MSAPAWDRVTEMLSPGRVYFRALDSRLSMIWARPDLVPQDHGVFHIHAEGEGLVLLLRLGLEGGHVVGQGLTQVKFVLFQGQLALLHAGQDPRCR